MNIDGLCAYTLRHSFATRMLKAGVDSVKLGILMGHKDPSMVAKIYQHLAEDDGYMLTVAGSPGATG
jgi:integrase